jgi:hypothetical protein
VYPDSKNHRAHWVALSRQALALLRGQDQSRELIFGTATDTAVQAWLRRWCERERISPAFRPHDLRRTCATRLNTLGVLPHIAEKILNHTMQGVMAVYNRADYEAERIDAMQRWADELDRILGQSLPLNEAPEAAQERPTAPRNRASGHKVLLDAELAALYGVDTRVLLQAVKRNRERFPTDFMIQLTAAEWAALRSQIVILKRGRGQHRKFLPYAFTEQGVAMLSSVLKSYRAIAVNIQLTLPMHDKSSRENRPRDSPRLE